MLQDYINEYCDAYEAKDKKKMRQVEGTLIRLGMDRATLLYLLKAELAERRKNDDRK